MKTERMRIIISSAVLGVLVLALPLFASADISRFSPSDTMGRFTTQLESMKMQLCDSLTSTIGRGIRLTKPAFCAPETPPPPPVDVCLNVPGVQEEGPCADEQCEADGGTWNGESCTPPPPPPVDVCLNVPGVQEEGPCADVECIEDGGTWNGEMCVFPPPEETIGHVVISEVHYDVDTEHGVNSGNNNNEWVEIYNGSAETVDLSGWKLVDNNATSTLPEGTLLLAGEFLIITATSSTAGFWPDMPVDVQVIVLGGQIGNGLAAGGDVVFLRNAGDNTIDAVSWGTNTDAFDPSVPGVIKGHSIARSSLAIDTDMAADWEDRTIPSPGEANIPLPN